ncbi:MAG: phosphatidate cytidylyltransferase [Acidiferrobacter sp.]
MLKTRIATSLVMGVLLIFGLFDLSSVGVAVLLGVFIVMGAFEWAALCDLHGAGSVAFAVAVVAVGLVAARLPVGTVAIAGLLWWLWAAVDVFVFQDRRTMLWNHPWGRWLSGLIVLVPAWQGCVALKMADPQRPWLLVLLLALVWAADSVAYFVGRARGRRRLAAHVSPGKSVEGAVGGLMGAASVAAIGAWLGGLGWGGVLGGIVFGALVGVFSIVGDLFESKAKRLAGVKDSGRGVPGHGGVLDRIDALTAAVPVFILGIRWLGVR